MILLLILIVGYFIQPIRGQPPDSRHSASSIRNAGLQSIMIGTAIKDAIVITHETIRKLEAKKGGPIFRPENLIGHDYPLTDDDSDSPLKRKFARCQPFPSIMLARAKVLAERAP
jgi:hypothetical protein